MEENTEMTREETPDAEEVEELYREGIFAEFSGERPDVKAEDIPESVWTYVSGGESLSAAWARYENGILRGKLTEQAREIENRFRSAGSRKSAGKTTRTDPFDTGWEDI